MRSPLSTGMSYPIFLILPCKQLLHSAASSPVQILLSYSSYFFLTLTGDRLGITTFAPASMPFSLPSGRMVPRAVVAGSRTWGCISLIIDKSLSVSSSVPGFSSLKGVACYGINGPIPTMCGSSSFIKRISSYRVSRVCPGEPTIKPAPT